MQRLTASETVKNIVVSYRLASYLFGESEGAYPTLPDKGTDEDREVIWKDLLKILTELSESGKQVYFVVQVPELPVHVQKIAFFNQSDTSKRIKGVTRAWWNHRNLFVFERLGDLPEDVIVVDPTSLFCDSDWCYASNSDGFLYFDDDHSSVYGATIIVEEFLNRNE